MLIWLKIDNALELPNGGPLEYRSHDSGFEIGRENRDWTLPDPDKFISGHHCEVRFESEAFWLHDVSRNGTFVNGSSQRITGPHRLRHGDRIRIGRYIVSVTIEDNRHRQPAPSAIANPLQPATNRDRYAPNIAGSFARGPQDRGNPNQPFSFENDPFLASAAPVDRQAAQRPPAQERPPSQPSQVSRPSSTEAKGPMSADDLLRDIAIAAGLDPEVLLLRDPNDVANEIGSVLRTVVDELALLLKARAAAKVLAKSSHRTMISTADNNPLKFVPGSQEILEIMFGRRRAGYLDARHSIEEAFRDLKMHEFATYAAMQAALSRLLDDLSPDAIETKLPASPFTSKKGRSWDAFVATWRAKEDAHENGMLDVFLAHFSEAYAKAAKQK